MNLGSKKAIIKAYRIILNILMVLETLSIATILFIYFDLVHPIKEYLSENIFEERFLILILYFCLYSIYFTIITLYFRKKFNQNKEQFYSQTIPLKAISIISIVFTPISGILLIVMAFRKDDGQDEQPLYQKPKKQKKSKPKYPREVKRQLRKVKHECRLGYISKELCEKKCNEIIKNYTKTLENKEKIQKN